MFINSKNILWLLTVIQDNLGDRYLSCICSLTLLGIVENHIVPIKYQEQEIIRKFNYILQNIEEVSELEVEGEVEARDILYEQSMEESDYKRSQNSVSSIE